MRFRSALGWLLGVSLVAVAIEGNAQRENRQGLSLSSEHEGRNFDARPSARAALAGARASALQQSRIDALQSQIPELDAQIDSVTGVTRSLWNRVGYLTGPDTRPARDIADAYIDANVDLLGLSTADVIDREVTDVVYSRLTGATHIYYRQRIGGWPVYNAQLQVHVNRDGRILGINNGFVPDVGSALNALAPALPAAEAVRRAADHLNVANVVIRSSVPGGDRLRQETRIQADGLSSQPVDASLMLLPIGRGDVRLVWNFQVHTPDDEHAYDFTVDADSGQVWTRFDWVSSDQYRVYPRPVESPIHSSSPPPGDGRTLVSDPADARASPFGWHDTNGAAGADYTIMRGNNVHAYADPMSNDVPPSTQPDCGSSLNCTFSVDFTKAPSSYTAAAIANLFYWNNIIHDVQYQYGFDEVAGNFQFNNYSRGGFGNDYVRAEAQDGEGTDNANFFTPPDGSRPRMQMYLWRGNPQKDAAFDAGIIVHEYGHGISNRLVGGPSNVSCLANVQQPGEGISDWLALVYTARPADTGPKRRGIGTYVLGQSTSGTGIRELPYTTDPSVNNWTYASIARAAIPHGVGAVWAQGLWRAYWALVNYHGFDANLYNAAGRAGNQRAMLYVNEGLKNTACSPTFTDVRNGIIQAAVDNHGGEDVCRLWAAFAAFGLGTNAVSGGPDSRAVTNGFSMPASCPGTSSLSINDVSLQEGNSSASVATFTVSLGSAQSSEVRVSYATVDETAKSTGADADYAAAVGEVIFPPGVTTRPITVIVSTDTVYEPDETFAVVLSAPVGATIADGRGTGTIINDDKPPLPGTTVLRTPLRLMGLTPTYEWTAAAYAEWYQLWVDDVTGNRMQTWYTAAQVGCASGGTCAIRPAVTLNAGAVSWWVRAWNASGYGPWSARGTFTAAAERLIVGLGEGGTGEFQLWSSSPMLRQARLDLPWPSYNAGTGELHPAAGDLDGDGRDEIVVGLGKGGAGWIAVFDDAAHGFALLRWLQLPWSAYNAANGTTWPAVGDIDGDGRDEIVAGLGAGGQGWLAIFDDAAENNGFLTWHRVSWAQYNTTQSGETHPAIANIDGGAASEIVIGLGRGGSGWLEVIDGADAAYAHLQWLRVGWSTYLAGSGETYPAAGDLDGDARDEIVVGLGPGSQGYLEVFEDAASQLAHKTWLQVTWSEYVRTSGETHPAVGNLDGDAAMEIVIGLAKIPGQGGYVEVRDDEGASFRSMSWPNAGRSDVSAAGAATFPAIGRLR